MPGNEICGYMSLLYSTADKPLDLWSKYISYGGKVRRVRDNLLGDRVIEITEFQPSQNNTIPTSVTIPAKALDVLNIKLPILALVVKNLNLSFKLDVQIMDKKRYRRRFSFVTCNDERLQSINANVACIPLRLEEYWNLLEINLQTLCHEAFGTNYEALQRITVYPNCYLRRVYLQDRHYSDDEIPTEMWQAFLDMYLLKRGIHFIEKACQTEDCHTGLPEQLELSSLARDSIASPTKMDLCENACNTEKLKSLNPPVDLNSYNSNILKRNHMSLDALNDAIKVRNRDIFTRQGKIFRESAMNDTIVENKLEKSSIDVMSKAERQKCAVKMHKTGNSLPNVKINNYTLQSVSSVELKRIAKSQFLKTHVSEILFKDNRFSKGEKDIASSLRSLISIKEIAEDI